MKKGNLGVVLGIVSALIGMILAIVNTIETINVANGVWTPIKENGEAAGAGLYIILLCVGVVLLIGGVIVAVKSIKNKKD